MSIDARKKERKRLKRQRKREQIRREHGGSPYARIARKGEIIECVMNGDWRERGQAVALLLLSVPGGGLALAYFLVDLWCCGLKDAWGNLDVAREQFEDSVDQYVQRHDMPMEQVDVAELRQVIAGGLRFAVQNGFRLPPHYSRWTNFVGDLGDWQHHADLTYFGADGKPGKLRYVGPMWDLRNRLVSSTVEVFMARKDVEVIMDVEDGPSLFDAPYELVNDEAGEDDKDYADDAEAGA